MNLLYTFWESRRENSGLNVAVEAKCLLVNPAIVGGLRDDERREAVKVFI
jgi:hypothetical protein